MRANETAPEEAKTETQLEKEVEPYRPWYRVERRAAPRLVAFSTATIAASVALIAWTLWSSPAADRTRPAAIDPAPVLADITETMFVEDPVDHDDRYEEPTALLARDEAIGEAVERIPAGDGDHRIRGVAAAADRYGVIAAWSDRVVWVSRDDGRSFRQELAAPEPLTAVAVGADGRVYAARNGGSIGVLSPAGHARWLDLGCDQVLAIDAAPLPPAREHADAAPSQTPWLAVLGLHADSDAGAAPLVWASGDHGRSWRRLVAPHHGDAANRVRVSPDGVIDLITEDSDATAAADGGPRFRHYRGHVDGRPFERRADDGEPPLLGPGHDGQSWRVEHDGRRMRLALATGAAAPALAVRNWDVRLAASRERTLAVADGGLVMLAPARPRVLTRELPDDDVGYMAVDGLGRAVASMADSVVRFSSHHGWRRLFEIPVP